MDRNQLGSLLIYAGVVAGLGVAYHDVVPSAEVRAHAAFAGALNGPLQPAAGAMRQAVTAYLATEEGCLRQRGALALEVAFRERLSPAAAAARWRAAQVNDLAQRYAQEIGHRAPLAEAAREQGLDVGRFVQALAEGETARAEALRGPMATEAAAGAAFAALAAEGVAKFRARQVAECGQRGAALMRRL